MGSDRAYPEEAPAHWVETAAFRIDAGPVTNAAFAAFVEATGHCTLAEQPIAATAYGGAAAVPAGGLVFAPPTGPVDLGDPRGWWRYVPGACWRHPDGPESGIEGRDDEPVVQIAHEDALAYAAWAGKRLPNEAEWEAAARGGLADAVYGWGDALAPDGRWMANIWQGRFPYRDAGEDGFAGRSPVGAFPPNGYGLSDMAGNVWEWTASDWTAGHDLLRRCCGPQREGASTAVVVASKVIKGGSYLCAPGFCHRFRPSARQPQSVDTATCHIGFRCVAD